MAVWLAAHVVVPESIVVCCFLWEHGLAEHIALAPQLQFSPPKHKAYMRMLLLLVQVQEDLVLLVAPRKQSLQQPLQL